MREVMDRFADKVTAFCGHPLFVVVHAIWWTLWILFDAEPYPYGLLTLVVSLEAIVLSTFILMSQNRMSKADRRILQQDVKINLEADKLLRDIHRLLYDYRLDKPKEDPSDS
jgi:uncharacterized membrane protein